MNAVKYKKQQQFQERFFPQMIKALIHEFVNILTVSSILSPGSADLDGGQ